MIKLIKSTFYKEKIVKRKLISFIQKSNQLSCGPEVSAFEKNFSRFQNRNYCIMVNSGSSANLALLQALLNLGYLKKGDAIGFSSVTWATNVMPILQLGLKAVPIDINITTLNISPDTFSSVIKKTEIKALFITHLLGFCDNLEKIFMLCKQNNIYLLEDTCEALGSKYKEKLLGNWGLASTFSFYVGHHLSTIEGGAICTDDAKLATMLYLVRAHGWDRNLSSKNQVSMRKKYHVNSTFYSRYTFYDLGYNFRPTEIQGFLGNTQLKYMKDIVLKRQQNFFSLASEIYNHSELYIPLQVDHMDVVSNFAFPIVCNSETIRDTIISRCNRIIETRPIVGGNIGEQPFFQKYSDLSLNKIDCKWAKIAHRQGLYIGNNPELTKKEIKLFIQILTKKIHD